MPGEHRRPCGAEIWMLASVALAVLLGLRADRPVVPFPGVLGDELPWWLAVTVVLVLVGFIHGAVNEFRRVPG